VPSAVSTAPPAAPPPPPDPRRRRAERAVPLAVLAGRLLLAAVLVAAGLAKAVDLPASVRAVRAYRLLPEGLAVGVAHALPFVELAVALLLLVGLATRLAAIVAGVLLVMFVAGIASAAARGLRIDCGCFGGGGTVGQTAYTRELGRDVGLLLAAVIVALRPPGRLALDRRLGLAPRPAPALAAPVGARRRATTLRAEQRATALRRRRTGAGAAAVFLLVLASVIGLLVGRTPVRTADLVAPSDVTAAGGVVVGRADAPVRLVAYEDPQCPVCGRFEAADGAVVRAAVAAGRVSVEYRMRSFLGPESVRAVGALGAAQAAGRFEPLREGLFSHQPAEGTGGFTTGDLLTLGRDAGITDPSYAAAVRAGTYAGWARQVDEQASRDGNVGTPEIRRDGKPIDLATLPALLAG